MDKTSLLSLVVLCIIVLGGVYYFSTTKAPMEQTASEPLPTSSVSSPTPTSSDVPSRSTNVTFKTNKGDITIELFTEQMPITTTNFLKLVAEGYYTKTKFHRVIPNFMIQGGDVQSKGDNKAIYGTGGPGYNIQDEFVKGLSNVRGTISMANTGAPNSGGSQFFINLVDNTGLDFDKPPFESSHPVFGKVIAGMDIVDMIAAAQKDANDVPLDPIVIETVEVK